MAQTNSCVEKPRAGMMLLMYMTIPSITFVITSWLFLFYNDIYGN
jgi:hypothetical protein